MHEIEGAEQIGVFMFVDEHVFDGASYACKFDDFIHIFTFESIDDANFVFAEIGEDGTTDCFFDEDDVGVEFHDAFLELFDDHFLGTDEVFEFDSVGDCSLVEGVFDEEHLGFEETVQHALHGEGFLEDDSSH